MSGIFPIPTTRASDILFTQRLLAQLQQDQRKLLTIQDQVSTGRLFSRLSENPQASVRGLQLQRLLESKQQFRVNITTTQSYLSATDTAVSGTLSLLRDVRGNVLEAINGTTTQTQRDALAEELRSAISTLVDSSNTQFRSRYLFAGTLGTSLPYSNNSNKVTYHGAEQIFESIADFGLLLGANMPGSEVFGGLSPELKSAVDLNPRVTEATELSELRGGDGIRLGTISISDGNSTSYVDLRGANTVNDVIRMIKSNPPKNHALQVELNQGKISISFDDDYSGSLIIKDVDGGSAARDLGITITAASAAREVEGVDLNARLTPLTDLSNLLGEKARARLRSFGDNNDILLEAKEIGTSLNGIKVQYVDDDLLQAASGVFKGNEYVEYSTTSKAARAAMVFSGQNNNIQLTGNIPGTTLNNVSIRVVSGGAIGDAASVVYNSSNKTLDLVVDSTGNTSVQTLIDAINAEGTFSAASDTSNLADGTYNPAAKISNADIASVTGNTTNSGGDPGTLFIYVNSEDSTALDVKDALESDAFVSENFNVALDPLDAVNAKNNGDGIVSISQTAETSGGSGTPLDKQYGIKITLGADTYNISIQTAETVQDVLNLINNSGAPVLAKINSAGNGLDIRSRLSGVDFSIGENGGTTATQLGIRTFHEGTLLSSLNYGRGVQVREGADFMIRRNDGVELEIDLSTAKTVGDVLNLINNHIDNQDVNKITARLAVTGNGIEILDDNPPGDATLSIHRIFGSTAAIDLGFVKPGEEVGYPGESATPEPAELLVNFASPNNQNNSFTVTASVPGTEFNGVNVVFVDGSSVGDQATATYDSGTKTLTIDIDPSATTAKKVVAAINAEGTFVGKLSERDGLNNGAGLIPVTGSVGVTTGGSSQPSATPASAKLRFDAPNHLDTSILVTAAMGGTAFNDVEIEFVDALVGDTAVASYDSGAKKLTIQIDAGSTTSNSIIAAINSEGTFEAELDQSYDTSNDGTGVVVATGVVATTANGTPEVFSGRDVNQLEADGVFNTISRLLDAISGEFDYAETQRLVAKLDVDITRVTYSIAEIGARTRAIEDISDKLDDEEIEIKATLSQEIDVDLVEAITNLTQQQATFEASLRMIGRASQLSLLDFL